VDHSDGEYGEEAGTFSETADPNDWTRPPADLEAAADTGEDESFNREAAAYYAQQRSRAKVHQLKLFDDKVKATVKALSFHLYYRWLGWPSRHGCRGAKQGTKPGMKQEAKEEAKEEGDTTAVTSRTTSLVPSYASSRPSLSLGPRSLSRLRRGGGLGGDPPAPPTVPWPFTFFVLFLGIVMATATFVQMAVQGDLCSKAWSPAGRLPYNRTGVCHRQAYDLFNPSLSFVGGLDKCPCYYRIIAYPDDPSAVPTEEELGKIGNRFMRILKVARTGMTEHHFSSIFQNSPRLNYVQCLDNANLSALPESVGSLTVLRGLLVAGSPLSGPNAFGGLGGLGRLRPHLQLLELGDMGPQGAPASLPGTVSNLTQLITLRISGAGLGLGKGMDYGWDFLKMGRLRKVYASNNNLQDVSTFGTGLGMQKVDLANNSFSGSFNLSDTINRFFTRDPDATPEVAGLFNVAPKNLRLDLESNRCESVHHLCPYIIISLYNI
jgi:hypothetical protein